MERGYLGGLGVLEGGNAGWVPIARFFGGWREEGGGMDQTSRPVGGSDEGKVVFLLEGSFSGG